MILWRRFILMCLIETFLSKLSEGQCKLAEETYQIGQTWNPVLEPFGYMECVNCTCLEDGTVSCVNLECPKPDCDEPKHIGCCPVCDLERTTTQTSRTTTCVFHGDVFKDGQRFPSRKTGLQPTDDSAQCVLCNCAGGQVYCHLKTCVPPPKSCKEIVTDDDDCCPRCKDQNGEVVEPMQRALNYSETDCLDPNGAALHLNGTQWNPVIGKYEKMKCIVCKCLNGIIDCDRIQCTPESELKCSNPKYVGDSCCKSCPKKTSKPKSRPCRKGRKNRKKTKKSKKKRRCKKDKKEKRRSFVKANITSSIMFTPPFQKKCLPRRTDRVVYMKKSGNYLVLAFENMTDKTVEFYSWTTVKGRINSMKNEVFTSEEYGHRSERVQLLGTTNKKEYKRFKRKLERQMKKCKSCRLKAVFNVLKRLRVKVVDLEACRKKRG